MAVRVDVGVRVVASVAEGAEGIAVGVDVTVKVGSPGRGVGTGVNVSVVVGTGAGREVVPAVGVNISVIGMSVSSSAAGVASDWATASAGEGYNTIVGVSNA